MLIAGLIVIAGLVYLALRVIPLTYDVKSSILLLPPTSSIEVDGNPFLGLGSLDVVAGVLAKSLSDTDTEQIIVPEGSDAEFTVQKDASISGSVLEVAVSDTSPRRAFNTLGAIQVLAAERLDQLQVDVEAKPESKVRLMVITNNTVAEPNITDLARIMIIIVAVGLVVTLLFAVSIDSLALRRRARKATQDTLLETDDAAGTPDGAHPDTATPDAGSPPSHKPARRRSTAAQGDVPVLAAESE